MLDVDAPLTELVRPTSLSTYIGQQHLTNSNDGAIMNFIRLGYLPSMILFGPPGVGKTTLANIVANAAGYVLVELSATEATVSTIRKLLQEIRAENVKRSRHSNGLLRICVFIDELHRFTKVQQDFLLPFIEEGLFAFIGATTVDPTTRIRPAIRSRCQLFRLNKLTTSEVQQVLQRAILYENIRRRQVHNLQFISSSSEVCHHIINTCKGDARSAVNMIELLSIHLHGDEYDGTYSPKEITIELVDNLHKDIQRQNGGIHNSKNIALFVELFNTMSEARTKSRATRPIDDSILKRTYADQMENSDDEYQSPHEHVLQIEPSTEISQSDYVKVKALRILLQLLDHKESPAYIAKQLILYVVLFTESSYSLLRQIVATLRAIEVTDPLHLLSDCIEAIVDSPKPTISEDNDPYLRHKRVREYLNRIKIKSREPNQKMDSITVSFDSSLVENLLNPVHVFDNTEKKAPFPVAEIDSLEDSYSVGTETTDAIF